MEKSVKNIIKVFMVVVLCLPLFMLFPKANAMVFIQTEVVTDSDFSVLSNTLSGTTSISGTITFLSSQQWLYESPDYDLFSISAVELYGTLPTIYIACSEGYVEVAYNNAAITSSSVSFVAIQYISTAEYPIAIYRYTSGSNGAYLTGLPNDIAAYKVAITITVSSLSMNGATYSATGHAINNDLSIKIYDSEYNDAYNDGYDYGLNQAAQEAYYQGYNEGMLIGQSDGYLDGFDDGIDSVFTDSNSDGYDDASYTAGEASVDPIVDDYIDYSGGIVDTPGQDTYDDDSFNAGYNEGHSDGISDAADNHYALTDFVPAILGSTFGFFFQLTSIEVLGISIISILTGFLAIVVVLMIIKMALK